MVGDAGCFVDPLFSGGVYLGCTTGYMAAKSIHNMLGGADEKKEGIAFGNFTKTGYDGYFRLVYGFYEKMSIPELFKSYRRPYPFCLQFLSGNFWAKPDDPLLSLLAPSRNGTPSRSRSSTSISARSIRTSTIQRTRM